MRGFLVLDVTAEVYVHESVVLPVFTYASECWAVTNNRIKRLRILVKYLERSMMKVRKRGGKVKKKAYQKLRKNNGDGQSRTQDY